MHQINLNLSIGNLVPRKRRGVAEVISSLLLVVITVVGAVILTQFIDESFVAGSLAVSSGTDTTTKTIKLRAYDTRDGTGLMGYAIDNNVANLELCRAACSGAPDNNPLAGGSEFIVIQIENRSVNPIYLKNLYIDNVDHRWDADTATVNLNAGGTSAGGLYPSDGTFSILSSDILDTTQLHNQITNGKTVNLLVKLHSDITIPNIDLSKTMRVQLNIGEASLAEFLIESGDTR